jgi:hypothetical protein
MSANVIPETGEIIVREQAPSLAAFSTASPALTLARGKAVADAAAPVIRDLNLVKRIHQSYHVYFDGWTMVGAMVGVFPVTVRTWEIGQDEGYGANVEARSLTGEVVGAADAIVMRDEEVGGKQKWLEAPAFQVVSMAQTRAGGKALRQPLGWIMRLAGYEATPAEEMDEAAVARGETVSGGRGVRPGWRDIHEQNQAHQRLNVFVANNRLGEWVGQWLQSKGYDRPMSKAQMADLRRAVDRELAERQQKASAPSSPAPAPPRGLAGEGLTSEGPSKPPVGDATGSTAAGPSDTDASVTGPGDTGVAGQEPPNTEASTSPPSASSGGGGTHRSGKGVRSGTTGKRATAPAPAGPPTDDAEQAAFDQQLADADRDAGKWTR